MSVRVIFMFRFYESRERIRLLAYKNTTAMHRLPNKTLMCFVTLHAKLKRRNNIFSCRHFNYCVERKIYHRQLLLCCHLNKIPTYQDNFYRNCSSFNRITLKKVYLEPRKVTNYMIIAQCIRVCDPSNGGMSHDQKLYGDLGNQDLYGKKRNQSWQLLFSMDVSLFTSV